ncbi:CHAD domain-containing protein [Salininema proteolyticum]|uniref:CHAD domain-containing protein n=1 Tax=Salininema proteolyticum TaxID=1607685 RepID=A0ABV8U3Z1_9ACTN
MDRTAGEVIADYVGDHVDELNADMGEVLRSTPGSAADTRQRIYRVRTAIRGYRSLFVTVPVGGPLLEQLLGALKRTRDMEALAEHFGNRLSQLEVPSDEMPGWYGELMDEREKSYRDVHTIAEQPWVAALLAQVRMFSDHPELTAEGKRTPGSLMNLISRSRTHMLDTYAKMSHTADAHAAREQARVASRDTWYMAEAAEGSLGKAVGDIANGARKLYDSMNDLLQAGIARTWLLQLPASDRAEELTMSMAELERREIHRLQEETDQIAVNLTRTWT